MPQLLIGWRSHGKTWGTFFRDISLWECQYCLLLGAEALRNALLHQLLHVTNSSAHKIVSFHTRNVKTWISSLFSKTFVPSAIWILTKFQQNEHSLDYWSSYEKSKRSKKTRKRHESLLFKKYKSCNKGWIPRSSLAGKCFWSFFVGAMAWRNGPILAVM